MKSFLLLSLCLLSMPAFASVELKGTGNQVVIGSSDFEKRASDYQHHADRSRC